MRGPGVLSCVVAGCMASAPIDAPAISVTEVTALGRAASPADWGNGLGSLAFAARGAFPTGSGLT